MTADLSCATKSCYFTQVVVGKEVVVVVGVSDFATDIPFEVLKENKVFLDLAFDVFIV